jgi:hypothetical protein
MNKKYIAVLAAVLTLTMLTTNANASLKNNTVLTPTVAIIDTAINASLPIFKDKIAYEVCILEWNSCPNGKSFMEGPGSANLPTKIINNNGFNHGTQMSSIAIQNNPNIKIVFVRIIGNTPTGVRQLAGPKSISNALEWVYANKDKFNIQAVSMAQGHHNLIPNADYCPKHAETQNAIIKLSSIGVPSFFAAGNNRDYVRIDFPACIPQAIAVGATDQADEITNYSNGDVKLLDFYARGDMQAYNPDGALKNVSGTSASTSIAATNWIKIKSFKPQHSYQELYDLISKTAINVKGSRVPYGKLIDVDAAING